MIKDVNTLLFPLESPPLPLTMEERAVGIEQMNKLFIDELFIN